MTSMARTSGRGRVASGMGDFISSLKAGGEVTLVDPVDFGKLGNVGDCNVSLYTCIYIYIYFYLFISVYRNICTYSSVPVSYWGFQKEGCYRMM